MVAYSFKARFVEPILCGRKAGTIRAPRAGCSHHAQPGDKLSLFVGMRTKACRLILRTVCVANVPVRLRWRPIVEIEVGGERLRGARALDAFARDDGFYDFADMEMFWGETHPGVARFEGDNIRWKLPPGPVEMGATILAVAV